LCEILTKTSFKALQKKSVQPLHTCLTFKLTVRFHPLLCNKSA
jgi:hypothetical protein